MALRTKTVEYAFPVDISTLASATRRDFAAITLYLPETTSRTFRSVVIEVNARSATTAAASCTARLLGIKLGATAFDDTTTTVTLTNTGDPESFHFIRDVTAYFASNFGAGASQTCQIGVSLTGPITANHCAKIYITYEYDDAATTRVKTVRIPIESSVALLTATLATVGPANQVPLLDTFLPEASKVVRNLWFECIYSCEGNATTDFNLAVALDADAETQVAFHEMALNGSAPGKVFWVNNALVTSAAHDFKARSNNLASRISLAVVLHVTYEYDHSTSTSIINSLVVPMPNPAGSIHEAATGNKSRSRKSIWIQEPTTIAMVQSGIVFYIDHAATLTYVMQVGAQSTRSWVMTAGSVNAGQSPRSHRIDSGATGGAALTLARGENVIDWDSWTTTANAAANVGGVLYLNYTSGKASDDALHNHSTCWLGMDDVNTTLTVRRELTQIATPNIPEADYFVTSIGWELRANRNGAAGLGLVLHAEIASGELKGAGWAQVIGTTIANNDAERGWTFVWDDSGDFYDRWAGDPAARMDPEVSRTLVAQSVSNSQFAAMQWLTYHAITKAVADSITGSAGGLVTITAHRVSNGETVASTSRTGDGAFSMTVYDDTQQLFVRAIEDGTHVGSSANDVAV